MNKTTSCLKEGELVIDTETTGVNAHSCTLLGISTNDGRVSSYSSFSDIDKKDIPNLLDKQLVGHNIKYDLIVLSKHGISLCGAFFDTLIAYYLLHIDKVKKLETIIKEVFNINKKDLVQVYNESTGKNVVNLPENWYIDIDKSKLAEYAIEDVHYTGLLKEYLEKEFESKPVLKEWFHTVEMPIVNILTQMELKGVKIDEVQLEQLRAETEKEVALLKTRLYRLAGDKEINFDSPKQLQKLLFEKFKLPIIERTKKKQPKTDHSTLEELCKREPHGFLINFLQYREYSKILSTYTKSLLEIADTNGRVHTNYNQALTNTRRFSSDSPNLQNIPRRSPLGKKVKGCFVPEKGHKFLIADYSQLEPRILAHLSKDKFLTQIFKEEKDVYEYTAEIARKAGFSSFTRDRSKILFLALMYGKSSYGLSQDWHCSQKEAEDIIQSVFKELSGVSNYIERVREDAFKSGGWLKSLAGLPLYVGNPHSNDKWDCLSVDRKAVNYPIQASSQDILKKALVNIWNDLDEVPVLMVHDELVYEIKEGAYLNEAYKAIIDYMESAWDLDVPLKVEWKITDKWEK